MSVIHMDTEVVRSLCKSIEQLSVLLSLALAEIEQNILGVSWQGSSRDEFCEQVGVLHSKLETLLDSMRQHGIDLENEIQQWEKNGSHFTNSLPPGIPISISAAVSGGMVLGVNNENIVQSQDQYLQMSWSERLAEQHRILNEISQFENGNPRLAELDEQIADLEQKMEEARQESDKLINKIITQEGKTLSKRYDEIATNYQQQIEALKTQRERELIYPAEQQMKADALNSLLKQGISSDGPTVGWLRDDLGGCTHYVAGKRDISSLNNGHPGDAYKWYKQASDAGMEVGNLPVNGSIIVFQPGVNNSDPKAGHVGIVESVQYINGQYEITYSQAGTVRTGGTWVRNTHTTLKDGSLSIPIAGMEGIGFIYE